MGKKKEKLLTEKALLQQYGVEISNIKEYMMSLSSGKGYLAKPVDFERSFKTLDLVEVCNRYKWKLPKYLNQSMIEQMLYYRGSLVGYVFGGTLYVLPYATVGGINYYGFPNKVRSVTFNGEKIDDKSKVEDNLVVAFNGTQQPDAKAVILYDRTPFFNQYEVGRYLLNKDICEHEAYIINRGNVALKNGVKKLSVAVENEAQADIVRNDTIKELESDSPVITYTTGATGTMPLATAFNTGEMQLEQLMQYLTSINNLRCSFNGIVNTGTFVKKERNISGELSGNEVQANLVLFDGLFARKRFIEGLKELYPENVDIQAMDVEINYDVFRNLKEEQSADSKNNQKGTSKNDESTVNRED